MKVAGTTFGAGPAGPTGAIGGDTAGMAAVPAPGEFTYGEAPYGEPSHGEPADAEATRVDAFPPGPLTTSPNGPRDEIGRGRAPRKASMPSGIGVKVVAVAAGALVLVGGGAVAAFALTGDDSGEKSAATVSPAPLAADAPKVDTKALEAQRRQQAYERASRAARGKPSKSPALRPKGTPIPTKKPTEGGSAPVGGDPVPKGEAQAIARSMLPSFGFSGEGQFGCLVKLWEKESGWRTTAANPSGAYGIPQALPGSKMASAGADWRTSARTQIKWGLGYIKSRYKTPCGGWNAFLSQGWY
ncbi:lytic transglycosylase domain-containing protein [Spirillospora sp. NPDC047279]|uniref:aggregation-promoting factor C-terminal-like domain-containing protein n=1 Tax=Spirillospora sp. NPDC047279 TaxID=3155478 RepID=UPI0033C32DC7